MRVALHVKAFHVERDAGMLGDDSRPDGRSLPNLAHWFRAPGQASRILTVASTVDAFRLLSSASTHQRRSKVHNRTMFKVVSVWARSIKPVKMVGLKTQPIGTG
jgi:hypothetical protein